MNLRSLFGVTAQYFRKWVNITSEHYIITCNHDLQQLSTNQSKYEQLAQQFATLQISALIILDPVDLKIPITLRTVDG